MTTTMKFSIPILPCGFVFYFVLILVLSFSLINYQEMKNYVMC